MTNINTHCFAFTREFLAPSKGQKSLIFLSLSYFNFFFVNSRTTASKNERLRAGLLLERSLDKVKILVKISKKFRVSSFSIFSKRMEYYLLGYIDDRHIMQIFTSFKRTLVLYFS